jgi:hypothetical protein
MARWDEMAFSSMALQKMQVLKKQDGMRDGDGDTAHRPQMKTRSRIDGIGENGP